MENAIGAYLDAILYAIGLATALLIYMPFSPMTIDLLMLPRGAQIATTSAAHASGRAVTATRRAR